MTANKKLIEKVGQVIRDHEEQRLEQQPKTDEELVDKMMQTIKKCFKDVPHAWQDVSRERLVIELRKLLEPK